MRKRRVYLGLLILAVAGMIVVIVAGAFRKREPEYGGKRLSEWVEILGLEDRDGGYAAAEDAVHHLGSNAVPGLLKWLRYETPLWKVQLYRLNPMLRRVKPSWIINEESDELRI